MDDTLADHIGNSEQMNDRLDDLRDKENDKVVTFTRTRARTHNEWFNEHMRQRDEEKKTNGQG